MVAAFRNLEIGAEGRATQDPRRIEAGQQMSRAGIGHGTMLGPFGAAQEIRQLEEVPGADEDVDLGQLFAQFIAIALREASGDHQAAARRAMLQLGGGENRVDRFLLGRLDERAGVYHYHFGVGRL